ncbi:MAG: DNA-formamidopyrimidine glycosylase [Ponticaulis sp.]|nr:DNA-formamidopyrimidine glycosylase [Ponticaulis sp.]|tara:strand:+ start:3275 stop:4129 length:855 start_codon:yes stop_codon:yes gene_type:complete
MPELPEVETVKRGLQPYLEGAILSEVTLNRPDLRFPFPDRMVDRLTGARITHLGRRAKYLVAQTDREETLVMHLGMSGRFTVEDPTEVAPETPGAFVHAQPTLTRHDHLIFRTDRDVRITFNDPRRFGYVKMYAPGEGDPFTGIGPEPLSNAFHADYLLSVLSGRMSPIKAALLDQKLIAGLGNIYVCEALFQSGISPKRLSANVGRKRADRLAPAIVDVLSRAIDAGGSSLKDYAHADGSLGYFQHSFSVYGREGAPCRACESQIQRIVQSGRSTFFCPNCQR